MSGGNAMEPSNRTARLAGVLYLSTAVTAPFSLIYVPRTLIVPGDAAATAEKLLAHEALFRWGVAADLIAGATLIVVVLLLRRLLSVVSRTQASAMAVLFLVSVPVGLIKLVHELGALAVLRGTDLSSAFAEPQREALAMLLLRLAGPAVVVAELFWGLWLFPFGMLVIRSGFLPRVLGALLIVNGCAYVALSLTSLLLPEYAGALGGYLFPAQFGELWIALWLATKGIRASPPATAA
jgi:hypothetical protein